MKLLVSINLGDRSTMHHLYPITLLDDVEQIMVVKDKPYPKMNKVQYYCPPNWSLKIPVFAFVLKFFIMCYLSIKEKPDLITGYLLFPHGILAFITGLLTGRKIGISTIAGPVELYAWGKSPIGKYSYHNPLPELSNIAKISLWILNKCDLITVTGSYTSKCLVKLNVDENKIFILPHVLDENFKFKDVNKEYDIIYVARLAPVKHVEILIKSIKVVKKQYPSIKVAIVGSGECRIKLEKLAQSLNLSENIVFVGYQSDVWNWYNKGKLSVLTSEREGFPYSVVEALSCGLPVISSNCGDVCDVIKDGYNGYIIVNYEDYNSFANKIIEILENPIVIDSFSKNALKTAKEMTPENVSYIWKEIFQSIS